MYRSIDEAWQAFDAYARLEPRLRLLWDLCRGAAPPAPKAGLVDDVYDADPFEADDLAAGKPDDGWCAEDYFLHRVKSPLSLLVGSYRPRGPHELQSTEAYETVYDLLINWALNRPCPCCAEHHDDAPPHRGDHGSPAYS
ncbi:MAG TPA: hypothetical protein VNO30_07920 [Kofleriaceae bacterium]|nr:hypothetical protein [Kofleriaceae bacterium]